MLNKYNPVDALHCICGILIHSPISQTKNLILLSQIKIRFIFVTNKDDYKNFA